MISDFVGQRDTKSRARQDREETIKPLASSDDSHPKKESLSREVLLVFPLSRVPAA